MKQVTGSNTPQATNKVSIQLTLDGHSFSAHGLDGEFPGEEPVEAELLTARTMLVPEEVLGTGDAGTLLAANGMAPAAEERAVCSLPVQGIVAVMAAHRAALRLHHPAAPGGSGRNTDRMGIPHGGAPIY